MGYYIDRTPNGVLPTTGKARFLLATGGTSVEKPTRWVENLVCVVENGMFDAAGYMYCQSELDQFADPFDNRHKTWIIYPNAAKLAGYER